MSHLEDQEKLQAVYSRIISKLANDVQSLFDALESSMKREFQAISAIYNSKQNAE